MAIGMVISPTTRKKSTKKTDDDMIVEYETSTPSTPDDETDDDSVASNSSLPAPRKSKEKTDDQIVTSNTASNKKLAAEIVTCAHNIKSIIDNNPELHGAIHANTSQLINMITRANPNFSHPISSLKKGDIEVEMARLKILFFNHLTESDNGPSKTLQLQPLIPDPSVFDGTPEKFEAWYFAMRDKLRGDNYFFVSEMQKIAYISHHLSGIPRDYITSKNNPRGTRGPRWVTAVQVMDDI